jgi:hypothetical protein
MPSTDPNSKGKPDARWLSLKLALLLLGIVAWLAWGDYPPGQPTAAPNEQQRMPVTHPILESDRPDLLGDPGTEMIGTDDPARPEKDPGPG